VTGVNYRGGGGATGEGEEIEVSDKKGGELEVRCLTPCPFKRKLYGRPSVLI
jgi:hypothetical protein